MAKLFYIIGPSGAGKDSVIHYLRQNSKPEHRLVFAHRYITRDAHAGGENHVALSEAEFRQRKAAGFFAMDWHSHSTYYGIGTEVEAWLKQGFNVVVVKDAVGAPGEEAYQAALTNYNMIAKTTWLHDANNRTCIA